MIILYGKTQVHKDISLKIDPKMFEISVKIFTLFLFFISAQGDSPINKTLPNVPGCESCTMANFKYGNRTGYQCHYEDGTAVRTRFGSTEYEYPECVPREYELTRDINEYCCFWSPELGCTVLLGGKSQDQFLKTCNRCLEICDHQQVDDNVGIIVMNSSRTMLKLKYAMFKFKMTPELFISPFGISDK
ncbi:uncharacterized protein LOC108028486 isoform X1 [Drosophila biarmipes]|uniref:uncharacterized protein LOC108028486 isoform X1 n=2 Tax=Drosophila biarmipes TaxID=125945 RepID=UPI0021CC5B11|nr:uncharacterized protein LOC108028486 isoform X1 [Drosophila biarmipes]